jgi:hypothetical protein
VAQSVALTFHRSPRRRASPPPARHGPRPLQGPDDGILHASRPSDHQVSSAYPIPQWGTSDTMRLCTCQDQGPRSGPQAAHPGRCGGYRAGVPRCRCGDRRLMGPPLRPAAAAQQGGERHQGRAAGIKKPPQRASAGLHVPTIRAMLTLHPSCSAFTVCARRQICLLVRCWPRRRRPRWVAATVRRYVVWWGWCARVHNC